MHEPETCVLEHRKVLLTVVCVCVCMYMSLKPVCWSTKRFPHKKHAHIHHTYKPAAASLLYRTSILFTTSDTNIHTYTYIHTCIHTYIPEAASLLCLPSYLLHVTQTYIHTYMRTYTHTCILTYIRTYIHAYTHTYLKLPLCFVCRPIYYK